MTAPYRTLRWQGDAEGTLFLTDQTRLPEQYTEVEVTSAEALRDAICRLVVRGAPAIGVAAAWGMVLGTQSVRNGDREAFDRKLRDTGRLLTDSRPTAVNLSAAVNRMQTVADRHPDEPAADVHDLLYDQACRIQSEDEQMCRDIGRNGAFLLDSVQGVLTHCNAGALATAGDGTALSVIFAAAASGRRPHVYADETRPLLQGARLTAWELQQRRIDVTVICDSMAAQVMKEGRVQAVITGADRITARGDAANKIGTYGLAVLAKAHDIPFYIAAPSTTFDLTISAAGDIPIEQRPADEITHGFGRQTVPDGVRIYNPAFDVTPAELISAIVTERGVIDHPDAPSVQRHLQ